MPSTVLVSDGVEVILTVDTARDGERTCEYYGKEKKNNFSPFELNFVNLLVKLIFPGSQESALTDYDLVFRGSSRLLSPLTLPNTDRNQHRYRRHRHPHYSADQNLATLLFVLQKMRFSLAVLSALFLLAAASPNDQSPLQLSPLESTKVPGKSPVELCSLQPQDDLVSIKYIDLSPNPPLAGHNLTIEGEGRLKTRIEEGAYAQFEVKYGFIKLLTGTADLCEKAAEVNLTCPIEKGDVSIYKMVELPSQIPPVSISLPS
jgi:ML domain